MIRKLLTTTAVAALVATGAYAQSSTVPANPPAATEAPAGSTAAPAAPAAGAVTEAQTTGTGQLASNLIGETVYNGTGDDAENIGDVNDLVIDANGQVEAIVIGVGGFLGIGEKNVALDFGSIDWAEKDGDRWIVVAATSDQLKQLPAFDRTVYAPAQPTAAADAPAKTDTMAGGPATTIAPADPAPAAGATDDTQTGAIDRSTLQPLDTATIRSEDLVGTTVYGTNDERIGEIGDVVLTQDNKIEAVLIDVGGFLGVGEKEVAVGMENLSFLADQDGDKYLYTAFTKEQLDAAPAYDEATFADKRNEMMLMAPRG